MQPLIYIQIPKLDPLKILKAKLVKEQRFEKANKLPSFRVALIKELIKEMEQHG